MNASDLDNELDQGKIFPVYLLYGEESYLIGETRKRIESICLDPGTKDFNYDLFTGGETAPDRIMDAAKTHPVMASWRVVVVKDAHIWNEQQVKTFAPYWEDPLTSTCLIFLGQKLGPWKRWVSVLEEKGRVVSFTHPRGKALTRYIMRGARDMGKEISVQAAELVREQVGNHLGEIHQELDKIASYVGNRNRIRVEDVEAVISPVRSRTVFDLTRAMGMKNCPEALKILNQMMEGGENHLKILTMMVRQFRLIWMAKDMQSQGMPSKDIGKALGVPEFVLRPLLSHMENFTTSELAEGYRRFSEADGALKSRSIPKGIVLENLIISLCRSGNRADQQHKRPA